MRIVRFLLKIVTLPITLILTLVVCFGSYIVEFSTGIFELISGLIFLLSVIGLISEGLNGVVIFGFVFGFIFFIIPHIAEWLLEKIEDLNELIKDFVDDIGTSNKQMEKILVQNLQKEVEKFEMAQERFKVIFQKSKDYADDMADVEFVSVLENDMEEYIKLVEEYNCIMESDRYETFLTGSKELTSKMDFLTEKITRFYEERIKANENVSNKNKNVDINKSLFAGCQDKDSIIKRYRQLMKTFHPDNQNGDIEMTQKIQKTYEELMKQF